MTTREILDRLECVTGTYPQYMAKCPAHDDRTPSLSIRSEKGKTLIHCFAGCETKNVLKAIGLDLKDLYKN